MFLYQRFKLLLFDKVWIRIKIAGWFCKKCSGAAARVTFFDVEGQGTLVSRRYVTYMLLENHSRTAARVLLAKLKFFVSQGLEDIGVMFL